MSGVVDDITGNSPLPADGTRAALRMPISYRLGRAYSLGGNRRYQYIYRRGKTTHARLMSLMYLKAREIKVGFSVSAKVGNSVVRHRVRRRMFEDFRLLRPELVRGSYVFVARPAAAQADWRDMAREMRKLVDRAGLRREQTP